MQRKGTNALGCLTNLEPLKGQALPSGVTAANIWKETIAEGIAYRKVHGIAFGWCYNTQQIAQEKS